MSDLIESVCDITATRDRDELDLAICELLTGIAEPLAIRFNRVIRVGSQMRVFCRIEQTGSQSAIVRKMPASADDLPLFAESTLAEATVAENRSVKTLGNAAGGVLSVFPIYSNADPVAWIELESTLALSSKVVKLLTAFIRVFANHTALIEYGQIDSLTSLMNRKTFDERFANMLLDPVRDHSVACEPSGNLRVEAHDESLWICVIDIDHFKRVNDRFGHIFGDEVLVLLAGIMRSSFRLSDELIRFGGEEFVVLLDRTPSIDAQAVFDRFCRNVAQHRFPQIGQVTVSVGFTEVRPGDSPTAAVERADEALYSAKKNGRNQVVRYEMLPRKTNSERIVHGDFELF